LWEKQLKEIEEGRYSASQFIANMKKMVDDLVVEVRMENNMRRFNTAPVAIEMPVKKTKPSAVAGFPCPKCSKGLLLKGTSAYGCSDYKAGCKFRLPFEFLEKKISVNQFKRLLSKGATVALKGFKKDAGKLNGIVKFDTNFELELIEEASKSKPKDSDEMTCPKCKKGTVIKGSSAYGCSAYKSGCDFRFTFDAIRQKAVGHTMSKELVQKILNGII